MQMEGQEIHTVNPERLIEARRHPARRPPPATRCLSCTRTPTAGCREPLSRTRLLLTLLLTRLPPSLLRWAERGCQSEPAPTHPPTAHAVRQDGGMTFGEFPRHFPEAVVVGILRRRGSTAGHGGGLLHAKTYAHLTVEMVRLLDPHPHPHPHPHPYPSPSPRSRARAP